MKISRQVLDSGIVLLQLNGRLDTTTSSQIKNQIKDTLAGGHTKIIIDLAGVPFIDSSGLVALLSGLRQANEQDAILVLCQAQSQAQVVFRLTMLDRVISVLPSTQAAIEKLL